MTLRIALFASSAFALPALSRLADCGEVVLVVSQPPRKAGRGRQLRLTRVAETAEQLGLPLRTPPSLAGFDRELARFGADAGVVVDYGLLLPDSLLAVPRLGFVNVHPSLLPRWRGAAPVERAMLAGDRKTGVSILRVASELDAGPLAAQRAMPVRAGDTGGDLRARLAEVGAEMLVDVLGRMEAGGVEFVPQAESDATYAERIRSSECRVDWSAPATDVVRRVQALSPSPGAWCAWRGGRLRLLAASLAEGPAEAPPGTLAGDRAACGAGWLRLLRVQAGGRKATGMEDWLRGARPEPGERLD